MDYNAANKMSCGMLMVFWILHVHHSTATVFHYDHICNTSSYIVPLELGDSGSVGGTTDLEVFHHMENCKLQLLSCDHCQLQLYLRRLDFPPCTANLSDVPRYMTCIEGCSHLTLLEPAYADVTSQYFLGENSSNSTADYISMSSSVVLTMCMASHEGHIEPGVFHIEYQVVEKIRYFNGSADSSESQGVVESPNFPLGYAVQGELYAYVLTSTDPGERIRVEFQDWDLSSVSRVYFYESRHNDTALAVFFGSSPRPVLLSPGPTLYVTFHPDVGVTSRTHNMGFRFTYTFVEGHYTDPIPITNCGEYFKYKAGGQILFPHSDIVKFGYYDCVWVINKISAFDWLFLKFRNVSGFDGSQNMTLTIKSGPVSDSSILSQMAPGDSYNISMSGENHTKLESAQGFYIRLNGTYSGTQAMSMVFAAFNLPTLEGCGRSGEFLCRSGNYCIDRHLVCDGHIHCSDASDESVFCQSTISPGKTVRVLTCKAHEFLCKNGRRCVPQTAVCDKWLDCLDGSDEYICAMPDPNLVEKDGKPASCVAGQRPCENQQQCIPTHQLCDGTFHCLDRSDEMQCALTIQTTPTRKSAWNVVIPIGIALCVVFFVCAVVMCIRNHYKHYHQYRPHHMRRPPHGVRRSRTIRSLTSETPLTLSLSRSTSGIAADPPDSPPSYEEATRHSPDGASTQTYWHQHTGMPNLALPTLHGLADEPWDWQGHGGTGQLSPHLLAPSGYLSVQSTCLSHTCTQLAEDLGNKLLVPSSESLSQGSSVHLNHNTPPSECLQHPSTKLDTITGNLLPTGLAGRGPKGCLCSGLNTDSSSSQGGCSRANPTQKEELIFRFPDSRVTCKGQQQHLGGASPNKPGIWEPGNNKVKYQSEDSLKKSSKPLFQRGISTLTDALLQSEDISA